MRILNFLSFINENKKESIKVPLQWTKEVSSILNKIKSPIKDALLEIKLQPSDITLINITDQKDIVSFTLSSKYYDKYHQNSFRLSNYWFKELYNSDDDIYHENRINIKIGRLINKLFPNEFTGVEISDFVSQWKSQFEIKELNFEISDEIKEAYESINYTFESPYPNELFNSCMNDAGELLDFYYGCPVKVLLLKDDKGYIWGRALLWNVKNSPKGPLTFMDKVYAVNEEVYYRFVNYAKENNWWWKFVNKSGEDYSLYLTNDGENKITMKLKIEINFNIEDYLEYEFPYLDTFCYGKGNELMNYQPEGRCWQFLDTDGGVLEID